MNVIKKIKTKNNSIIWVSKIEESINELLTQTDQTTNHINEIKKKEFYASRILIQKVCKYLNIKFNGIEKNKDGKPFLIKSEYHLSISHKYPYVSVIIDDKPCGVDLERIDEKVKKIKSKFLTEEDEKIIGNNLKKIVKYWSIKETAYKIEGNFIPLKKINVIEISENFYSCSLNNKTFKILTEEINGYVLSYTI